MNDDDNRDGKPVPGDDPEGDLEREVRRGRRFDLAEALGRAGAGSLKGASPVARARQVLLEVRGLLEARLPDPEGSLTRTILARLESDTPLLARHFAAPAGALAEFLDRVLASPALLADLVRDADARWGRDYGERPRFERGGSPAPDDPYTEDGVAAQLRELRAGL